MNSFFLSTWLKNACYPFLSSSMASLVSWSSLLVNFSSNSILWSYYWSIFSYWSSNFSKAFFVSLSDYWLLCHFSCTYFSACFVFWSWILSTLTWRVFNSCLNPSKAFRVDWSTFTTYFSGFSCLASCFISCLTSYFTSYFLLNYSWSSYRLDYNFSTVSLV